MRGMDLKSIFNAISFERHCNHGKNMTYHEYMTAAMHNRLGHLPLVDLAASSLIFVSFCLTCSELMSRRNESS